MEETRGGKKPTRNEERKETGAGKMKKQCTTPKLGRWKN